MHNRAAIGELLARGGLSPRRDLGQNFVADANTVRRIARLADVGPGDKVVEIGADLSLDLGALEDAIDERTRLVAVTHASNAVGAINSGCPGCRCGRR